MFRIRKWHETEVSLSFLPFSHPPCTDMRHCSLVTNTIAGWFDITILITTHSFWWCCTAPSIYVFDSWLNDGELYVNQMQAVEDYLLLCHSIMSSCTECGESLTIPLSLYLWLIRKRSSSTQLIDQRLMVARHRVLPKLWYLPAKGRPLLSELY